MDVQLTFQVLGGKKGIKLVGQLLQKERDLHGRGLVQLQVHGVDVKKLPHQLLQPSGLVQSDVGILCPLLLAQPRLVPEQLQITQHRGKGRFQIVGQERDQLLPPPLLLPQLSVLPLQLEPQISQLSADAPQGAGSHRLLLRVLHDPPQVLARLAQTERGQRHRHPHQQ